MKMKVTSPEVTFNPVTVELTFESLEELLVLKTTLGMCNSAGIHERLKSNGENMQDLDYSKCDKISYVQYYFFARLLEEIKMKDAFISQLGK